jgi:protein translocase SecG subunit
MYEFITSPVLQIVLASLLIVTVLLQKSEKGMDGAFGGASLGTESIGTTKRGFDLTLYKSTIFFSLLLAGSLIIKFILA